MVTIFVDVMSDCSGGGPGAKGGPVSEFLDAAVEGAGLQQVEVEVDGSRRRKQVRDRLGTWSISGVS